MKVYIVRHGETRNNALKLYNSYDDDLNDTGIEQAKNLRDKIVSIDFDIIFSSPLIRTRHTTDIININNKNVIFDDRLKERNIGNFASKPLDTVNRDEYWNYNTSIQYGTSENIKLFFNRVYSFLDDLKLKKYESVLIVAHSGVSKAFSAYFEGIGDGMFLKRGLKNCEIKEYEL